MKTLTTKTPPVSVGETLTLKCEGTGKKGDGVFKKDGYTIFAENVTEGRVYILKVKRMLPTVGFADVIDEA